MRQSSLASTGRVISFASSHALPTTSPRTGLSPLMPASAPLEQDQRWAAGAKHDRSHAGGAESAVAAAGGDQKPGGGGKMGGGRQRPPKPSSGGGGGGGKGPGGGGFMDVPASAAPIVDIGLNLGHKSFQKSLPDIVARALGKGVTRMVITGTSQGASEAAVRMANDPALCIDPSTSQRILYATAGVHPHDAKHWGKGTAAALRALLEDPACVAVGECGLDFNRNFSPPDAQERVFEEQARLAVELGKPLFCHERDAHAKFLEVLDRVEGLDPARVCVHCFTGARSELEEYVRRGFFVGFTGCVCDDRRGAALRGLVPLVPLGRTMVETDAPFMMPTGGRGRNEPANLPAVLRTVAECHGIGEGEAAEATTRNAVAFFGLGGGGAPREVSGGWELLG